MVMIMSRTIGSDALRFYIYLLVAQNDIITWLPAVRDEIIRIPMKKGFDFRILKL